MTPHRWEDTAEAPLQDGSLHWRCPGCGLTVSSVTRPGSTWYEEEGRDCVTFLLGEGTSGGGDRELLCQLPADCDLAMVREIMNS